LEGPRDRIAPTSSWKCASLIRCIMLAMVPLVNAWDKDGHEAIGMTAMSALATEAGAEVKRIMQGRDAVDVAAWAHKVNKKYPWTVEFHSQRQAEHACAAYTKLDVSDCPDNRCLVKGLKHFYGHLVGKKILDVPWPANMSLTDADRLKYAINLVGDLHQPMHFAPKYWLGSEAPQVEFRGERMSLFDFWEKGITKNVMRDAPSFWLSGWTHVQRTRVEYEMDGERWKKEGIMEVERWADETAKFLCESVLTDPITNKPLSQAAENGVIRISEDLFDKWKRDLCNKILVAGARTAIVLNAILTNRVAGHELRGGTAVKDVQDDIDEERSASSSFRNADAPPQGAINVVKGLTAGVLNLGIFALVGIVFLQVMRMWQGRDAVSQADRAKHGNSGKRI